MSTRKEKAQKASEERGKRSYKLKPIQGDSIGDRMVREQLGKPAELPNLEKRPTFSDMLAPMRETARQEKTDALKMQKYYALADVFNALGKMGGAAVGGAIGGNMLDSAPTVGEYKESRGYLDAFERAKQANERLRDLDAKEFQLAYDKRKRDEEIAYSDKVRKEDREYKAALDKADKEWQKKMIDYKAKIEQATATGNLKLKAQLEAEAQAAAWQHQLNRDVLLHGYDMEEKRLGQETIRLQKELYADRDSIPFTFNNGTAITMPKTLNEEMLKYFAQKGNIGGTNVDIDNVADVLRDHPDLVNGFLLMHGLGTPTTEVTIENPNMTNGTYNQPHDMKAGDYKSPDANKDDEKQSTSVQGKKDYSSYKRNKK